jgi:ABC-type phosphate transport system substrate-binding protein
MYMVSFYRFTFSLLLLLGCAHAPAWAQDQPLVIIGNPKGVPADLKLPQLKATMRGERLRWPDGSKVVIALLKSTTPIGQSTSKKVYNMSANELNKYWLALVFQGKADAPNFFSSEAELAEFVAQTTGAIGVVSQPTAGSKTITIDGKRTL